MITFMMEQLSDKDTAACATLLWETGVMNMLWLIYAG